MTSTNGSDSAFAGNVPEKEDFWTLLHVAVSFYSHVRDVAAARGFETENDREVMRLVFRDISELVAERLETMDEQKPEAMLAELRFFIQLRLWLEGLEPRPEMPAGS